MFHEGVRRLETDVIHRYVEKIHHLYYIKILNEPKLDGNDGGLVIWSSRADSYHNHVLTKLYGIWRGLFKV